MKWNDLKQGHTDRVADMANLSAHELLGVDAQASKDDIKAAYLRLVKAYHPDRSDPFMARHNLEITKLVNAAYKKLRDSR